MLDRRERETRIGVTDFLIADRIEFDRSVTHSSHPSWSEGSTTIAVRSARYTQADPNGLEDDVNLYAYAGQRPLTVTDPLGLSKIINRSCVPVYVKPEDPDGKGLPPKLVQPGKSEEGDGFFNGAPDRRTCYFFCDADPGHLVRKINNLTNVIITGGCNGSCLKWSYSGPISAAADKADPDTGWKGRDFLTDHPDWKRPPRCCPR